ncbi:Por secretion system C-terminal sorting domain-containing protein [Cytophaga hutchinsonii ATCC 33406]|nr:Por secretion system C-terminal sorting domain-containing protein [Cytophaga hutchinsonii ATCC 33406]
MKTKNMIKNLLSVLFFGWFLTSSVSLVAQTCATDLNLGENLVVNGDFSNGYTGWSFDAGPGGYKVLTSGQSLPGDILVGTNPQLQFNTGPGGFNSYGDHTTGSGNFLMVDGQCSGGATTIRVWYQTVNVVANTNYYFSVWISSLKDMTTDPGNLRFNIGGNSLGANILAPAKGGATASNGTQAGGGWIRYEIVWNSGSTSGPVPISIQNNNLNLCGSQVDFGIDDIAFTPGCSFGAPGPQPNLGPDLTLCGRGGAPITLDANVPQKTTTNVYWNDGLSGSGLTAPYTRVISTPGTYSVCVTDNGSCVKSDVIVITNTISVNIGGPYTFCSSTSQVLDAGYAGIGATYKWYRNGVLAPFPNDNKTYTATSAGTYRVDVSSPGCVTASSTTTITSSSTVTPIDGYYCATAPNPATNVVLAATNANSSTLKWFTTPTGGTEITSGVTTPNATTSQYTIPSIPAGTTATQTYYVQDEVATTGTAAAQTYTTTGINYGNGWTQSFNIVGDVTVNSLQIPFITNYQPGSGWPAFTVTLEVVSASGASLSPARVFTSQPSLETVPADNGIHLYTFPFTGFTISSAWGSSLRLKINGNTHGNGQPQVNTSGFTYPIASNPSSAITITGANTSNNASPTTDPDGYAFFYNWKISAKYPCARVPVRAISNCPQPVTWTTFYLTPLDNACKLTWGTADEKDNKYFAVERSADGINFEIIGNVEGGGNRDIASNYYFIDNAPLAGTSYYRITQHDFDGKFSSTAMRAYSSDGLMQVTTYPNPFLQSTTLLVTGAGGDNAGTYSYSIYAVNGQLIEYGTGSFNERKTIAEGLSKGMYMLTVSSSTDVITTKIVKQ